MTNEENVNNINNTNEDDLNFEENDSNTWTACGLMANLPTEIYCGNSLESAMEQRMLSVMSRFDKETDKNYSRLLYKTSSVLRPINNTLRMVYASKLTEDSGDSYESWLQLEQTVLNSRALLLDTLSYGNDLRRELALKNLSSNYRKPTCQRGVFGDKIPELVQQENEINKLFNEAAFQKKRAQQNSKQKQYSPVSFKSPITGSQNSYNSYKGKNHHWIASFGKNWVTDIVQYGYRPEWLTVPPLEVHSISPNRQYKKDLKIFYDEIQALLRIGAIRELDIDTPCFLSNLFLVPKKGETLTCHRLTKTESNRRFCFTCLPFSLTTSPRVFTKILRPVIKSLQNQGIRLMIYLDDILIMAKTKDEVLQQLKEVMDTLERMDLQSTKKSQCSYPLNR
ncbi:unnamed protein product [Rhizophagus irregularis]|nr:unnamed protein product [Rhizophagus irregularis]